MDFFSLKTESMYLIPLDHSHWAFAPSSGCWELSLLDSELSLDFLGFYSLWFCFDFVAVLVALKIHTHWSWILWLL